ncbi:MAG TPA: hypothetical protein VFI23_03710 [Rhizomicrobium sp.]|nr:hypothetical protein [Rhizomicrobium sp.]
MHEYEIRVLSAGHTVLILEETHLSDHAAVRSGRKFAGDKAFEVWRGLDCIYAPPKARRPPGAGSYPSQP